MKSQRMHNDFLLDPWEHAPQDVLVSVASAVPFEQLALACLHAHEPQVDEFLLTQGFTGPELAAWCQIAHQNDRFFRASLRTGLITSGANRQESESSLIPPDHHALALAIPDSFSQKRWWWLLLVRRNQPFTPLEQQHAGLLLRRWMMRFSLPHERGLSRVLLGHDHRILQTDLSTQETLLREPDLLADFLTDFPALVAQRYPNLQDHVSRDLAVQIAGQPRWVCFRKSRAVEAPRADQWSLELRPLDADDLPAVGLVKDDRIAQAITYIHEHFHMAPSLGDIAHMVHISPFHFHRLFTRQVGISPKVYLQRKQLQVAKWLLRKGGIPIGQIAKNTGFSSHGHFTSTFHRVVGFSPSEYRDQA